tara:strand:- start:758 stop:1057 length:300 start_codon:yes stop_codon:yes gene_type:complete
VENENIQPQTGSLTITGQQVTIQDGDDIVVGTGSLALTGQSVAVNIEVNVTTGLGTLTITGLQPSVTTDSGGSGGILIASDSRVLRTYKNTPKVTIKAA